MLFHCQIHINLSDNISAEATDNLYSKEFQQGTRLMESGKLVSIWRSSGKSANISLYDVRDRVELDECLRSLTLYPFMEIVITELETHPLTHRSGLP